MSRAVPFSEMSLPERFSRVMERLREAVAARAPRDRVLAPLAALLWNRLGRMTRRFVSIAARVRAGRSVRAAARTPAAPGGVKARPSPAPGASRPRWPREFGWLCRLVPGAGCFGSDLQNMLADPEMVEILAASPQARRVLRSLFRMLAVVPGPELALPGRERRSRSRREAAGAGGQSPNAAFPVPNPRLRTQRERVPRTPGLGWLRWPPIKDAG